MEDRLDPALDSSLQIVRQKLALYIKELESANDDLARKLLEGWTRQMTLVVQFRVALKALQASSINGPGAFLPSIVAHVDDLVDVHAGSGDTSTDSADDDAQIGYEHVAGAKDLEDALRTFYMGTGVAKDKQSAPQHSSNEVMLQSHHTIVRSLFDTLQQASKLSDRRIWLCPLHADGVNISPKALYDHLMDGTHGISEAQADVLIRHAVTRPIRETDDAWDLNCDAKILDAYGQVMDGVAAIVADFCIAADTVQLGISHRSDHAVEGDEKRLVELRQLHKQLTQASQQCRQRCHDEQQRLGAAFEVGDDIAFQDLYNVHRSLSRQFDDIATLTRKGALSLAHYRNMCFVAQRGQDEAVLAMVELSKRLNSARIPKQSPSIAVNTQRFLPASPRSVKQQDPADVWRDTAPPQPVGSDGLNSRRGRGRGRGGSTHVVISSASPRIVKQQDPAAVWRSTAPSQPAGSDGLKSRRGRGGKAVSVTSDASTVFSERAKGASSNTSVPSVDAMLPGFGANDRRTVIPLSGYRAQGFGTSFFSPGRVFEIVQTDVAGPSTRSSSATDTSTDSYGQSLISRRRAFISVRADATSCVAVPITNYGGQGVSKSGVVKAFHCIVHTTELPPRPLAAEAPDVARQEEPMQPYAIRIDADPAAFWKLDETSRLNLGEERKVDHWYRVKNLGKVGGASMPALVSQLRKVRELRYSQHVTDSIVDISFEKSTVFLWPSGLSSEVIHEQIQIPRE
ncbi:hypothetical protein LTR95_014504 [Oleoguttula sp. CCFEE 5521]